MDSHRFDRQILMFGAAGQQKIADTSVAIVGLGGLGSHVAQQLAYLGIQSFALIDGDRVETSNLNRLVGATEEDATTRQFKVLVAARAIKAIERNACVETLETTFVCREGYALIASADIVVGCIDSDAHRLILNELCQIRSRPYLDIATDTGTNQGIWFGGRVLFSTNGELCLVCKGLLNQEAIRRTLTTVGQREEEERIYGVPQPASTTGPSVVSLNGILASVAVMGLMVEMTGIGRTFRSLEYIGMKGILTVDRDPPQPDCYYCKGLFGSGDDSNVIRLAAEGWGEIS